MNRIGFNSAIGMVESDAEDQICDLRRDAVSHSRPRSKNVLGDFRHQDGLILKFLHSVLGKL